jgi:glutamate transport system permease protein
MYTDLLQESRRLGSMYFNILQTLVVAAVIYFIVCWLLSRLAAMAAQAYADGAPRLLRRLEPLRRRLPFWMRRTVSQVAARKGKRGAAIRRSPVAAPCASAPVRMRPFRIGDAFDYIQGYDFTHPESQPNSRSLQIPDFLKPIIPGLDGDDHKGDQASTR